MWNCFYVIRCGQVALSEPCRICLQTYIITSEISTCLTDPADRYVRSYGNMLISRKELKDRKAAGWDSNHQFYGYLQASVSL